MILMTLNSLWSLVVGALALPAFADKPAVKSASVFSDHIVLQRGQPVPV